MTNDPRPAARQPQVVLSDLTSELLWPRILRAPALAARPARIGLGMAAALLVSFIGLIRLPGQEGSTTGQEIAGTISRSLAAATESITTLDHAPMTRAVTTMVLTPGRLIGEHWAAIFLLALIAVVLALFGGAISRATATEFTTARFSDWTRDLRTSLSKLPSTAGALLAPYAVAGFLIGLISLGGGLLGVPVLDLVGSLLYGLSLLLALGAITILVLQTLALPILVPSLMVEGTDGFDAVQRCYAYILARPLRLLAHAAILLVLGAVSITVVSMLAASATRLADWAATGLTNDAGLRLVRGPGEGVVPLEATQPVANSILSIWRGVLELAVSGYAISYFFAAGTTLYLTARRVCDGQETHELWDPENDPA